MKRCTLDGTCDETSALHSLCNFAARTHDAHGLQSILLNLPCNFMLLNAIAIIRLVTGAIQIFGNAFGMSCPPLPTEHCACHFSGPGLRNPIVSPSYCVQLFKLK